MTNTMTKTEVKHEAQLQVMHMLSNTLLAYQEANNIEQDLSDPIQAEIIKQMDRVAKLMGYTQAWHS